MTESKETIIKNQLCYSIEPQTCHLPFWTRNKWTYNNNKERNPREEINVLNRRTILPKRKESVPRKRRDKNKQNIFFWEGWESGCCLDHFPEICS